MALDMTKSKIQRRMMPGMEHEYKRHISELKGLPPISKVVTLKGNFQDILSYSSHADLRDGVDYIVSGAAMIHNTDINRFFSDLKMYMKNDSTLLCWDWNGGPTWAAPYLRLGNDRFSTIYALDREGKRHKVAEVPEGEMPSADIVKEITDFDTEAVYTMLERSAVIVEANLQTWLGLQGYIEFDESTLEVHESEIDGAKVSDYLHNAFWSNICSERGFSYVQDFLKPIMNRHIHPFNEKTAYHMIEGYGVNHADSLDEEGYRTAVKFSLDRMRTMYKEPLYGYDSTAPNNSNAEKLIQFTLAKL
jgi:hypothetical protein